MTVENDYKSIIACCTSQICERRLICRRVGASELIRQDIDTKYACNLYSLYVGEPVIEKLEENVSENSVVE